MMQQTGIRAGGADVVVDASGAESSIRLGVHVVKPGGTFVQAGMGKDDVNFPIAAMCSKELTVRGSFRYGPGDYETAIKLMGSGKVNVSKLITDRVPFSKAEEAFSKSRGNGIKTIIAGPSCLN
jgi:D-xylulose reductase